MQAFSVAIDLSTLEPALITVDEIEDHGQVCSRRAKCKGAIVSVSIHFGLGMGNGLNMLENKLGKLDKSR